MAPDSAESSVAQLAKSFPDLVLPCSHCAITAHPPHIAWSATSQSVRRYAILHSLGLPLHPLAAEMGDTVEKKPKGHVASL